MTNFKMTTICSKIDHIFILKLQDETNKRFIENISKQLLYKYKLL